MTTEHLTWGVQHQAKAWALSQRFQPRGCHCVIFKCYLILWAAASSGKLKSTYPYSQSCGYAWMDNTTLASFKQVVPVVVKDLHASAGDAGDGFHPGSGRYLGEGESCNHQVCLGNLHRQQRPDGVVGLQKSWTQLMAKQWQNHITKLLTN